MGQILVTNCKTYVQSAESVRRDVPIELLELRCYCCKDPCTAAATNQLQPKQELYNLRTCTMSNFCNFALDKMLQGCEVICPLQLRPWIAFLISTLTAPPPTPHTPTPHPLFDSTNNSSGSGRNGCPARPQPWHHLSNLGGVEDSMSRDGERKRTF